MAISSKSKRLFLIDTQEIRKRVTEHLDQGPITPNYGGDVRTAIEILNEALATEIVCWLRYKNHYYMASGIHGPEVATEFLEHAEEERHHADQIAERIHQLGGNPNYNPEGLLSRSHSQYEEAETLVEMIVQDLVAERIAIESYREMVRYFGDNDPTTRRLLEEVLAKEEEHADDLSNLIANMETRERRAEAG